MIIQVGKDNTMLRLHFQISVFLFMILGAALFALQPAVVVAETAGSYVHPDIGGPDEGNPINRPLMGVASSKKPEGSGSKPKPSTRTEGSSQKGYGPGAHPHKSKEGSGSKKHHGGKYGHGHKKYAHGKKQHGMGYGGHSSGKHGGSHGCSKKRHGGHGSHGGGHHGHGGHKTDPFHHVLKFRSKLGLNNAQVEEIREMRFNWEKQRIKLGADHMIAHMELDRLVHSGTVDADRMQELAKLIAHIKGQEIQAMVDAKIGLLRILTDEQRKKVASIHSDHH